MESRLARALFLSTFSVLSGCGDEQVDDAAAVARQSSALIADAVSLTLTLPATGVAGTPSSFTVTARNSAGAIATGYTNTVRFGSNFPQVVMPADYTFTAADQGQHTFSFTPLAAGPQTVSVTDTASGALYAAAGMTVTAGPGARFLISNVSSPINVGVPMTFDVTAYDLNWNVATSYAGTAFVSTDDVVAVLPASPAFVNGVATGVRLTFNTSGARWYSVTDSLLPTMSDTAWATVNAGPNATVTAPSAATTGTTGLVASVAAQTGASYAWSITGGTITSGTTANTVTFTAGAVGTLRLTCVVTNSAGASATGSANVTVLAPAGTLTISAPTYVSTATTGNKASVTATTGRTYRWTLTGGTITSAVAGVTSGGLNTVTYTAGAVGTATLTCVESTGGIAGATATRNVTVVARPVKPVITSATPVTSGTTGLTARVPAVAGRTYTWTITGGTLTNPSGVAGETVGSTNTVTFTAGAAGTLKLTCVERNQAGLASTAGTKNVTVVAAPVTPTITAASPVVTASTGNTARVTARTGFTYVWTLAGGTITSAGGTAGVTSGGFNTITWTAGAAGTASFTCVERNSAGALSAPATASVTVSPSTNTPVQPTITAPTVVTSGVSATASVTARTGLTYAWTIAGGTITSANGAAGVTSAGRNTITFTPGAAGTLSLSATETNGVDVSAPGTASMSVIAAPQTPVVTAPSLVQPNATGLVASITPRAGMTYEWTIIGGSITAGAGTESITFTAGAVGNVSLGCVERNSAGATSAPGTATVAIDAPKGIGHFYAVGHQDDDVIFFDPDIGDSIRAGVPTHVTWLIAGSSGSGAVYWQGRENQAKLALASEANVSSSWTCAQRAFAGKLVTTCSLAALPTLTASFFRLPDGDLATLWATQSSTPPFYVTAAPTLTSADGATTYTHAQLIDALTALIADFGPARIATMDSTLVYGDDNPDHVASALFTLEAARRWGVPHQFRVHRGYSVDLSVWGYTTPAPETPNLSAWEMSEKDRVMLSAYGLSCASGGFSGWCARHYAITRLTEGSGALVEPGGFCLDTAGGATTPGTAAVIAGCSGVARQSWTIGAAGTLSNGSGCLAVGADNVTVRLETCNGSTAQNWMLFSNGQLRGRESLCVGVDVDGVSLKLQVCDANRATSQYTPALEQRFAMRSSTPSSAAAFSDAELGSLTGAHALRLGDVDGDGLADACLRRADGLRCAPGLAGGGFGASVLASADFADAAGWATDATGLTLQLVDLDGDGHADVCGRGAQGVVCANAAASGLSFGAATLRSSDFSDAAGFGAAASVYGSVRFGDVSGDGRADVCARGTAGVVCALGTAGGGFAAATTWSTTFSDAAGYGTEATGATLQLGDLNGDARADVCVRATSGLTCALSTGAAFTRAHLWSFRTEFTDAGGWAARRSLWGSFRLGDADGDGLADACARSASGLVCSTSTGTQFDGLRVVQPAFSDLQGWQPDAYGASLAMSVRGAHSDVCGRGPAGVTCTRLR